MSALRLDDIKECFEGMIPSTMVTANADGLPNINNVSKVEYVDATHVALSRQFFRKSAENLASNPHSVILVCSPSTNRNFKLHVRLERIETDGPIFDQMKVRIDAIASLTGMAHVFKLEAAYIFVVDSVDEVVGTVKSLGPM